MPRTTTQNKDGSTEAAILEAAKRIFIQKGFAGARMQEVADEAGINKAMLHYYFRSKMKLFRVILDEAVFTVSSLLHQHLGSDKPLLDKMDGLVREYTQLLIEQPHLPMFVMNEISQNQENFVKNALLDPSRATAILSFFQQVREEAEAGNIREVSPVHLLFHLMGMTIFPFISGPIVQVATGISDEQYNEIMNQRAEEIMTALRLYLRPV